VPNYTKSLGDNSRINQSAKGRCPRQAVGRGINSGEKDEVASNRLIIYYNAWNLTLSIGTSIKLVVILFNSYLKIISTCIPKCY